jgi:hypothetical protein
MKGKGVDFIEKCTSHKPDGGSLTFGSLPSTQETLLCERW